MGIIRKLLGELKYVFLNCVVSNLPFWSFRKFFYVLFGMRIGKGSKILMQTRIYAPEKIMIAENTWIHENCYIDGRGGINIGSNVTIATYAKLVTGSHNIDSNWFEYAELPIEIGNNVAIFTDCVVLGGGSG